MYWKICFVKILLFSVTPCINLISTYTCLSILLATFNYRVGGTYVPTRAFYARITCKAGITLNANYIVLTARQGVFSDYSLQCLQKKAIIHVFAKKLTRLRGIFNNYKAIKNYYKVIKVSPGYTHAAAIIES